MKVVYLCAPYRAATEYGVHCNIESAGRLAVEIWRMGAVCLCPHKNTGHFGGKISDEDILAGDLELLRRCDAVMVDVSLGRSGGMTGEIDLADDSGIPIFYSVRDLQKWLKEGEVLEPDAKQC
jgi:hypothetical protein